MIRRDFHRLIAELRRYKKTKAKRCSKGFTLVELLVYMGIISLLLVIMTGIFLSALENQSNSQSTSSVSQDGRFIYSRLIYDISTADGVSLPANLGDSGSVLQLTKNSVMSTYSVTNGNLNITAQSQTEMLNSYESSVSAFFVKRIGNPSGKHTFQIKFTISGRQPLPGGSYETRSFQTAAGLR